MESPAQKRARSQSPKIRIPLTTEQINIEMEKNGEKNTVLFGNQMMETSQILSPINKNNRNKENITPKKRNSNRKASFSPKKEQMRRKKGNRIIHRPNLSSHNSPDKKSPNHFNNLKASEILLNPINNNAPVKQTLSKKFWNLIPLRKLNKST